MNLRNGNMNRGSIQLLQYEGNLSSPTQYKLQNIYQLSYHQCPSMYQQFLMEERMKIKQFPAMQIITEANKILSKIE